MITDECRGSAQPGAAKQGAALLAGILRCLRCGRKLTVSYSGGAHRFLRYACVRGHLDNGESKCLSFGGIPVDERVSREVLRVVQPTAIESALQAAQDVARQRDEVLAALGRDLEAARYAAQRAQKQYDATDPDNRLVADELEHRWNTALQRVRDLELRLEQQRGSRELSPAGTIEDFADLADDLEAIWNNPASGARLKNRMGGF
jgi:hypothetical protein